MRGALVVVVALSAALVTTACGRDKTEIRADDARARGSAEPSPGPAPSDLRLEPGELLVTIDEWSRITVFGRELADPSEIPVAVLARPFDRAESARVRIHEKASSRTVVQVVQWLQRAGIHKLVLASASGGPVALTIGGGASLTIGGGSSASASAPPHRGP